MKVFGAGYKDEKHRTWLEKASEAHNKAKFAYHLPYTDWGNLETGMYLRLDIAETDRFLRTDTMFVCNTDTDEIINTLMVNTISLDNGIKEDISPSTYGGYLQWD